MSGSEGAGFRQRSPATRRSLTVWFTDEAIRAWRAEPRTTRGGQPWYSALAILTALTLRAVFRLAFRQTEGLTGATHEIIRPVETACTHHSRVCVRPRPPAELS